VGAALLLVSLDSLLWIELFFSVIFTNMIISLLHPLCL